MASQIYIIGTLEGNDVHRLFAFPYVNNLLKHPLKSAKNLYLVKGQIHEGGMI